MEEEEKEFKEYFKEKMGWTIDRILDYAEKGDIKKVEELFLQVISQIHFVTEELLLEELEEKAKMVEDLFENKRKKVKN